MTACDVLTALCLALPSITVGMAIIIAARRRVRMDALEGVSRGQAVGLVGFLIGSCLLSAGAGLALFVVVIWLNGGIAH